jgi:hypothetical protein
MKKRCNRRHWDTGITSAKVITQNEAPLSVEAWNLQVIPVQAAVNGLLAGDWAGFGNWGPVVECRGRIRSLLKLSKQPDHGFIDELDTVCVEATTRFRATGSTAFRHDERTIVQDMVAVYGNLLKEVTAKQFNLACQHARADRARVLGGNRKRKSAAP